MTRMFSLLTLVVVYSCLSLSPLLAEVRPATLKVKDQPYWVGQRVPFTIELRAQGSFTGTASFSFPDLPRAWIMEAGNPVVSSEEVDDQSWFVQTHDFALFSQQEGKIEIPAFDVRFSHRDGFTGPSTDQTAKVPATTITIERPEGVDSDSFLVTTTSLKIEESWDPEPGKLKQGDVAHRTITQDADQMTGMALTPPPELSLNGIRVHVAPPEVTDQTERGEFRTKRVDRITYVFQEPGVHSIPAINYVWWNPDQKSVSSTTLPEVTFDVAATVAQEQETVASTPRTGWYLAVIFFFVFVALLFWHWQTVCRCYRDLKRWLFPPKHVAARRLIKACRHNDANSARVAWWEWRGTQPEHPPITASFRDAIVELERTFYGPDSPANWTGRNLETSFRDYLQTSRNKTTESENYLPEMNSFSS
ncbi:MAG: hypothetical protein CMJ46_00420 [Planctomyces sp.]|nr:hypothetical protein [Planctomyces sp.]